MASANITLGLTPATIETDTTERTMTFTPGELRGVLYNDGTVKVFFHTTAGTVATSDAQDTAIVGVPPGLAMPKPRGRVTMTYKSASAGRLYWYPAG